MLGSEAQGRAERTGKKHMRRCVATGQVRRRDELLRLVIDPEGGLVADAAGKLPGRGLWITPERAIINRAGQKGLFARAAKRSLRIPDDLAQRAEDQVRRRCLNLLGLARRAGLVVAGFEKVRSRVQSGKLAVLVQAGDASHDGRDKLSALLRAAAPGTPEVTLFRIEELGQALGRAQCVHVALASGGLTDRFLAEVNRLARLADVSDAVGE